MHHIADSQYSANKLFFELLAHNDVFEDLDEIEMINFNLSLFATDLFSP